MKDKNSTSLEGQKVIIIGGSSGIGLATAQAAAKEGATVIIVSGNQNRLDDALKTLPENASGFAADVSKEANIKNFFEEAGSFDHLVYTAGENLSLSTIADLDIEKAKDFLTIRFWGALATVKYAAPNINKGGSISLTSGIASQRPGAGWAMGASICGAMDAFTKAMAVELAPVRVNNVSPGIVKTNLWNFLQEEERTNLYQSIGDSLLVKTVGEAEDIAQTYIYLMKQKFSSGQTIVVDGGGVLV